MENNKLFCSVTFFLVCILFLSAQQYALASEIWLPDGIEFTFWEQPLQFSKTYYVDCNSPNCDDNGPGTIERPFRTISKAAEILQPGERVVIGCTEELRTELETTPRLGDTIIVGERGRPLKAASLGVMVRRALSDMGVQGYSIHGLRKNAGNALAEADGTEREIMVRLGHRSPQMAAHYTKRASQKKLARSAVEKLERAKAVR